MAPEWRAAYRLNCSAASRTVMQVDGVSAGGWSQTQRLLPKGPEPLYGWLLVLHVHSVEGV